MIHPVGAWAGIDGDGVPDQVDNCVLVPNSDQADADAGQDDDSSLEGIQHYGDACDADLDDDGITAVSDFFSAFRPCLGAATATSPGCADADLDGDGIVAPADFFSRLRSAIASGEKPGPGVEELPCPTSATAVYRATLDATWSDLTHPQDPPSRPHFSALIGGTHDSQVSFWQPGALASPGIQEVAELGNGSTLAGEVLAAVAAGSAEALVFGDGIPRSPGQVSTDFGISQQFPLLTLVTMVAPSPDWFVGVHGLDLRQPDGSWIATLEVPLFPYDSGTDSGVTFTSSNSITSPAQPIHLLDGFPFLVGTDVPPLGSFVIERIDQNACQP